MRENAILTFVILFAILAAIVLIWANNQQSTSIAPPKTGESEINNLGQYQDINLPESIGSSANPDELNVDVNGVDIELPERI